MSDMKDKMEGLKSFLLKHKVFKEIATDKVLLGLIIEFTEELYDKEKEDFAEWLDKNYVSRGAGFWEKKNTSETHFVLPTTKELAQIFNNRNNGK